MCIIPKQIHVELLCLNGSPFVFRSLLLLNEADGFLKQNVSVFFFRQVIIFSEWARGTHQILELFTLRVVPVEQVLNSCSVIQYLWCTVLPLGGVLYGR